MAASVNPKPVADLPLAGLPIQPGDYFLIFQDGLAKKIQAINLALNDNSASAVINRIENYKKDTNTWTDALNEAQATLPQGGKVFLGNSGEYTFVNPTLEKGVALVGNYETPPFPGSNQSLDLNGLQICRITGTWTLKSGAGLYGLTTAPTGMSFPQPNSTAFTGTGVTIAGDSTSIRDVLAIGFQQVYQSVGYARTTVHNFFIDGNNGVYLDNNADTTGIYRVHAWGFATIQAYAASTGSDPAGRDGSILYRTGIGFKFRNHNDDTQADGLIAVGYQTGFDFESTAGARFGRLWSECFGLANTNGVRFGTSTDNIHIQDLQLWHCANPILMQMGGGNRVSCSHIAIYYPGNHALNVQGGNISFDLMHVRFLAAGNSLVNLNGANAVSSYVSGLIVDESSSQTQVPVLVPPNFPASNLRDLKVRSPYRPAGATLTGGNTMISNYILSAADIALKVDVDDYKISGPNGNLARIAGGHHGRTICLTFNYTGTVFYGDASANGIQGPSGVTQRAVAAGVILMLRYDAEYGSWREVVYTGAAVSSAIDAGNITSGILPVARLAGIPNTALAGDPAWTAFTPTVSMTGTQLTSASAIGSYVKLGRRVHCNYRITVSTPGSASGVLLVTLPFASANGRVVGFGSETATTGKMVIARSNQGGTSQLAVVYFDNVTGPIAAGSITDISVTYESAT